jgi:hypothetical protein
MRSAALPAAISNHTWHLGYRQMNVKIALGAAALALVLAACGGKKEEVVTPAAAPAPAADTAAPAAAPAAPAADAAAPAAGAAPAAAPADAPKEAPKQ